MDSNNSNAKRNNSELKNENALLRQSRKEHKNNRDKYFKIFAASLGVAIVTALLYAGYVFGLFLLFGGAFYPPVSYQVVVMVMSAMAVPIVIPAAAVVTALVTGIMALSHAILGILDAKKLSNNLEQINHSEAELQDSFDNRLSKTVELSAPAMEPNVTKTSAKPLRTPINLSNSGAFPFFNGNNREDFHGNKNDNLDEASQLIQSNR